jgi:hypothetical protein|tara:strand:+ start:16530 stop:17633 length:1104 start_codon:yes stop_codon:yes gene_type:complete
MDPIGGAALGTNIPSSPGARARNRAFEQPMTTSGRAPPTASATCSSAARPSVVAKSLGGGARAEDGGEVRARGENVQARARLRGPTPLTVDVQSAETETDARERVRFYELCSPRMLGDWTDDRTCVVNVTGGMGALQGAGEELISYLRNRLGVVMEVDTKRERVRVNHEIPNVVIEAARILHLQIEQAKMVTEGSGGENNAPTPTPKFGYAKSVDDEAVMHEILRDISQAEIEELRRQVESKRATRQRLIETLGEPRVTCHLQPIELTSTLVRIRLPRKHSFSEERLYAVGIALRAVASTNSAGKPTWIFQCDMGESKLHETDIMYISNDAITVPEVCRLLASQRQYGNKDKGRHVMDEFYTFSPAA